MARRSLRRVPRISLHELKNTMNREHAVPIVFFQELVKDQTNLFIVGMMQRPGVSLFAVDLEYHHFNPDTSKNDLFQLGIITWEELQWCIIWVPIKYKELVWQVAEKTT